MKKQKTKSWKFKNKKEAVNFYKEISNLACPKCGHKITNKDLKYWRCTNCGKSFKERTNL